MNFKCRGSVEKAKTYISVVIGEELCLDYWFTTKSINKQGQLEFDNGYLYNSDYVFLEVVDGQVVDKEGNIDEL